MENASKKMRDAAVFRRHDSSSHLGLGRGLGAASEAASTLTALQSGASPERCRHGVSAELRGASGNKKSGSVFLDGCLGFVRALSGTQSRSCPWRGKINDS